MSSKSNSALAGALSGTVGRAMVQPLDVIKIRLQLQVEPVQKLKGKYSGMTQAIKCIYQEEGFKALWKGHMTGQIHAVSFSIIQFYVFTMLQRNDYWAVSNSHTNFIYGSLSGMAGIFLTHPLDVLRTRFVAQGEPRLYNSFAQATSTIIRNEGFLSLYKGLTPNMLLITPQTGLQFFFYGFYNRVLNMVLTDQTDLDQRSFMRSAFCGGLAGITAKTAVYPLDLVKKRMQIQGFEEARSKFGALHKSNGLFDGLRTIVVNEGFMSIFKGLSPSLVKAFLSIGLKFSVYEACLKVIQKHL